MERVIFLTGATGLVGSNLIPRILKNDNRSRLILLIRGESDIQAERRLDEMLWDLSPEIDFNQAKQRIQVIRGDITLERLGLSKALYKRLAKEITHIIHSAATVQFQLPLECAHKVNCEGTKHIIALAKLAKKNGQLQRVAYISTAYVSGNREGRILEDELDCGQEFGNTYEQTKFESEKYVRSLMNEWPITIFRPSIIVGDSKTGKTTAFNVLYVPLKLIYRGIIKILPGSQYTPLDVVPVDFVCDAINYIFFNNNECVGRTYHLTASQKKATTTGQVVDLASDFFNQAASGQRIPQIKFLPAELCHEVRPYLGSHTRRVLQAMEPFEPYLSGERAFDNANTCSALKGTEIAPPQFRVYYQTILRYCIETNWGKSFKYAA
ncbi:MAG: SDR family oxidoreductase [Candidatus Zixiibacteriota bacterium]